MSGTQRGDVSVDTINDELRVAYLDFNDAQLQEALDMAQHEWVSWTTNGQISKRNWFYV